MKVKKYCEFCGEKLKECECTARPEITMDEYYNRYYDDATVIEGMAFQDKMDSWRDER